MGGLGKLPDSDSEAVSPDLTSNSHYGKVEQSQTEHLRCGLAVGPLGCDPVHGHLPSPDRSGTSGCPSSLDTYEYNNALEFAFVSETRSHYIAQVDLEFMILLSQSPYN